jgi:hypothetical protein
LMVGEPMVLVAGLCAAFLRMRRRLSPTVESEGDRGG